MKTGILIYYKDNQDTVTECIESVLSQTSQVSKIILINDASSLDVPKNLDSRILIEDNEFEAGTSGCFLQAVNIMWNDVDVFGAISARDKYLPNKIAHSLQYFENYKNAGLVYSDFRIKKSTYSFDYHQTSFQKSKLLETNPFGPSPLVHKNALEKIGLALLANGQSLTTTYKAIAERFVAFHIAEILCEIKN